MSRTTKTLLLLGSLAAAAPSCAGGPRTYATAPPLEMALPYPTPGLAALWPDLAPGVQAAVRDAAAAFEPVAPGPRVAAGGFNPDGPDVTQHVARAIWSWLQTTAIRPQAVGAYLADARNFFPDCTICAGVKRAFERYRDLIAAEDGSAPAMRWLSALDGALPEADRTRLAGLQARSATYGGALRDACAAYLARTELTAAERDAVVRAAKFMDELTTKFAASGEDPAYSGLEGCALCEAAADGFADSR